MTRETRSPSPRTGSVTPRPGVTRLLAHPLRIAVGAAVAVLLVQGIARFVSPYEFHRDELLYLAMGKHLRVFRMDFPPFIALAALLQQALFGRSLAALHVLPALAAAALAFVTVDSARRLGAGTRGQLLAAICFVLDPVFLRSGYLFQPVVFDQLWWTLGLWALLRRALDDEPRWWLAIGLALGMGLLTKFSVVFIGAGILLGVLASPLRRDLASRWPWLALILTVAIGLPSLTGQLLLDFPVLGQMEDLKRGQLARVTPVSFLQDQLFHGPAAFVALAGLAALVLQRQHRRLRAVGIAAGVTVMLLLVGRGKGYYAGPVYPVLFGAGAAWLDGQLTGGMLWWRRRALVAAGVLPLLLAPLAIPFGLPVLEPPAMARFAARLGGMGTETNRGERLALPQDYADMIGWQASVDTVARVVRELSPAERAQVVVVGENYGRAGALDWYGPARGVDVVVAPVGSYWFFGPGPRTGEVVVMMGGDSTELAQFFGDVRLAARHRDRWRVSEERDVPVFVLRQPRFTLQELWPRFRGQN